MADLDKRIPELNPISNPSPDGQMVIYDVATDTTYRIPYGMVNPGATELPDQWDPDVEYAAGEIVSYSQGPGQPFQIWVSSVGSNEGNVPGPVSAFWETPVDTPSVGFPAPWAAGIYTAAYVAVVYSDSIYWLNPALSRPYNSTDIASEIIAGDWINLGSTSSGTVTSVSSGNLSPLFTVAVGTPTTTPALSFTLSNAAQNAFLAGPSIGGAGAPVYRLIVAADIPDLSATYQPADPDLLAIAGLGFTATSFLKKTAANTWALDTTTYLPIGGGTLTGTLTLNADPVTALEAATKQYVDGLLLGLWNDRGSFNPAGGAYPSTGGSGSAGAIRKGDIWTSSGSGTLPTGQVVEPGDTIRALTNAPGNVQADWAIAQNNIGYTPLSSTLTSANVFVGSAGNLAVGVPLSGAISITNAGVTDYVGTVPVNKGGTNITSYAVGDILYASGGAALSKLAAVAAGSVLGSAGVTTAPAYLAVSNGLTATSTTLKLGGALTADTNLSGAFSLGIGVAPVAKFHVLGLGTTTGELCRLADSAATTRFSMLDNGSLSLTGGASGAGATVYTFTPTVTATANTQTQYGGDFNMTLVDGGFTGLTRAFWRFRLASSATNTYEFGTTSFTTNGLTTVDFKIASDSVVRNSSGALSLKGGSGSSTGMIKLGATTTTSVDNAIAVDITGAIFAIPSGSGLTRTFTGMRQSWTLTSANVNTIKVIGLDYNPDLSAINGSALTHIALKIQSGLSTFGHTSDPTAFMDLAAGTTAAASLRIRSGAAPTSPVDGQIWYDGTDIKMRVGGTTKTFTLV